MNYMPRSPHGLTYAKALGASEGVDRRIWDN